jgi:lipopolysaccharide assembly outer membrane protein LptD (OstA)
MINGRKNSLKQRTAWILTVGLFMLVTSNSFAHYNNPHHFYKFLTTYQQDTSRKVLLTNDTIPKNDTIPLTDSLVKQTDTFHVKVSKDSLDGPVNYTASDSMVLDIPNKKIIFYREANIKYTDVDLKADSIEFDQVTKIVTATYRKDTAGNIIGRPTMIQGESNMEADLIKFNFETQKGITENTLTQQGEMFVHGEKVKKISPTEYYAFRGVITTCNLDTPHFAFRTKRLKLVSQKMAITGPIHPEFEGVPVPVYIPFGFFRRRRRSPIPGSNRISSGPSVRRYGRPSPPPVA